MKILNNSLCHYNFSVTVNFSKRCFSHCLRVPVLQAPKAFSARKISLSSKSICLHAKNISCSLWPHGIISPKPAWCFPRQQGLTWRQQFRGRPRLCRGSWPQEEVGLQHCRDHQEALHQHHHRLTQGSTARKPPVLLRWPPPQTFLSGSFSSVSDPGHSAISRPGCCGRPAPRGGCPLWR